MLVRSRLHEIADSLRLLNSERRTLVPAGDVTWVRRLSVRRRAPWRARDGVKVPQVRRRVDCVAGNGGEPVALTSARTLRVLMTTSIVAYIARCELRRDSAIIAHRRGTL